MLVMVSREALSTHSPLMNILRLCVADVSLRIYGLLLKRRGFQVLDREYTRKYPLQARSMGRFFRSRSARRLAVGTAKWFFQRSRPAARGGAFCHPPLAGAGVRAAGGAPGEGNGPGGRAGLGGGPRPRRSPSGGSKGGA